MIFRQWLFFKCNYANKQTSLVEITNIVFLHMCATCWNWNWLFALSVAGCLSCQHGCRQERFDSGLLNKMFPKSDRQTKPRRPSSLRHLEPRRSSSQFHVRYFVCASEAKIQIAFSPRLASSPASIMPPVWLWQ